eukprot:2548531-Rhodomonas_salina.1
MEEWRGCLFYWSVRPARPDLVGGKVGVDPSEVEMQHFRIHWHAECDTSESIVRAPQIAQNVLH